MRTIQYHGQILIDNVTIMKHRREVFGVLKISIKHLFLILSKQKQILLLPNLSFQRPRYHPKQCMRQNNSILRRMIVEQAILFRRPRFMQLLLHLSNHLLTHLHQFFSTPRHICQSFRQPTLFLIMIPAPLRRKGGIASSAIPLQQSPLITLNSVSSLSSVFEQNNSQIL